MAKKGATRCTCRKAANGRKVCTRKDRLSRVRFCKAPKKGQK